MKAQWSFPHHADDCVATDGGNPVRPISTFEGHGEEISERNVIPNAGEVGSEGEEITGNPTPGSSPNAKHAVETMKTDSSINKPKSKAKKMDRVETSLKESSRDLSLFKFKSGAVGAVVLFVVFGLLNSLFEGKAVAKLPFVPVRIVQKMSHRGLQGDDPTDCSMAFLYFLCSISIRTNLQKFLGFSPPRGAAGAGLFPMPDSKTN